MTAIQTVLQFLTVDAMPARAPVQLAVAVVGAAAVAATADARPTGIVTPASIAINREPATSTAVVLVEFSRSYIVDGENRKSCVIYQGWVV